MPTQFSSSASTVRGLTRAALCTACACLLAPVSIPIGPVSLTLGVFAILLAGALLPPALAALSACAYLLLGFAGLPVFAGFSAGPGVLFGMTGGYLLAYPIMAWLLSNVPNNRRLITIEEGSREFDLVKRDAQGNILNSVVHLLTRPSENPALNINQDFLLERVLRKHPDVIGVGEMRSAAESLSAAESSRTGHTVCTTIHSNSCNSTYRRMMTLAKRKYNMDDSILMQIMVEAYPIIVFTKQLEDRSRKIMEIIEGEDYQDGRLIAHSLYKYEVEDNVTDDRGETRVVGHHKKIGLISDSLKKRLLDNGISNKELEEFMQPPKEVG